MGKERPNKVIREYGKASKVGLVLVKKRNPTLATSQWKKRAMGLFGTLLVFSEVGQDDQVKEDDKVTEELVLPRSAQVVIRTVLGVACVRVETTQQPVVFRLSGEQQGTPLQEWADAIRAAVEPPTPGSVDPMVELEALMKRKDLTTSEARRAQTLMRERGYGQLQPERDHARRQQTPASESLGGRASDSVTNDAVWQMKKSNGQSNGAHIDSTALPMGAGDSTKEIDMRMTTTDDAIGNGSNFSRSNYTPDTRAMSINGAHAHLKEFSLDESSTDGAARNSDSPASSKLESMILIPSPALRIPPKAGSHIMSAVYDGEGNYYGSITPDGTCYNACGTCIGYINDCERSAGSSNGSYLGCVSKPQRGAATVETPAGLPLARLDLGCGRLSTLAGSTIAEFLVSGEVVANLGHAVCRFDKLSFRDLPTMALYLSFVAPDLLQEAAHKARAYHDANCATGTVLATIREGSAVKHLTGAGADAAAPASGCGRPVVIGGLAMFLGRQVSPSPGSAEPENSAEVNSCAQRNLFVAIADFIADRTEWQVSISRGALCRLLEDHHDGWSTVQLQGSCDRGAVPTAFIEPTSYAVSCSAAAVEKVISKSCAPGTTNQHRVLHDFVAVDAAWQLAVSQDEQVCVVMEYDDGWSEVIKSDGSTGLVPSEFLKS